MRQKPVGTAEWSVLRGLALAGGTWSAGDRLLWESRYWTIKLLGQLVSKGLAKEVVADVRFELTDLGKETLATGSIPTRPAKTGN